MRNKWIHLQTLFLWAQPELLLENLRNKTSYPHLRIHAAASCGGGGYYAHGVLSRDCYLHYAQPHLLNCSPEEIYNRYESLLKELDEERKDLYLAASSIFTLPYTYGREVLTADGAEPLCRQEEVLGWRVVSLNLGQYLFACAFLAGNDVKQQVSRTFFAWPGVLRTNEPALRHMLEKGISENHFHLNGSTQSFPITWVYLMNHPRRIYSYFQQKYFRENLRIKSYAGPMDDQMSWEERMYYAAWLRTIFVCKLCNDFSPFAKSSLAKSCGAWSCFSEFDNTLLRPKRQEKLYHVVERLRQRAARFPQPNGVPKCLDYAISAETHRNNDNEYRLLSGERVLLYGCFRAIYEGKFSPEEQDLFYLYLLLKQQFRSEIIQNNGQTGFRNFCNYQDRKDLQWSDHFPEYLGEARLMAVNAGEAESIQSLEMRITPKKSVPKLRKGIQTTDHFVAFAEWKQENDSKHLLPIPETLKKEPFTYRRAEDAARNFNAFYAVHFIKTPEDPCHDSGTCLVPIRNWAVRRDAKTQAIILRRAMACNRYLRYRIRAIDAATFEIGCRPETFATEFRYLRSDPPWSLDNTKPWFIEKGPTGCMQVTYHAGEDFLDLADGMRAIDEAICYLNLQRGDRIGHALALGVAPELHYKFKENQIWLPRQNLLDNLIWILYRCRAWGITLSAEYQMQLERTVRQLLREIYPRELSESPNAGYYYYESWKLRGDSPGIYRGAGGPNPVRETAANIFLCDRIATGKNYWYYAINRRDWGMGKLSGARQEENILRFLYAYHFDAEVRRKGDESVYWEITKPYICLMHEIQDRMIERIEKFGIAIECNPSSNVLIGTFHRYEFHPIFRFNHYGLRFLESEPHMPQLKVSVNTDDQGVFDTSLEFEYALLMSSLQRRTDDVGRRLFSDDEILAYLNHLRDMGNEQAFRPKLPARMR